MAAREAFPVPAMSKAVPFRDAPGHLGAQLVIAFRRDGAYSHGAWGGRRGEQFLQAAEHVLDVQPTRVEVDEAHALPPLGLQQLVPGSPG